MIRCNSDMKKEVRENMREGAGAVTIQHYFAKDEMTCNSRLCAKMTIPPGAGIGKHQHDGEDEVYIVTNGTGVLDDGTQETRVNKGDAILTGNGESHAIRNDGQEPLEIIAVIVCY
ncbi:cupin domain-containing protein [PVC group bacterium]|nr:cupin domain-containing protein [PVC group bacterium]